MKHATIGLAVAAGILVLAPATAQTNISARHGVITTIHTVKNGKQIDKVTCREFLALREEFKPQAIAYAIGYDKAKKPEDAVFDVTGVARLTPVVEKNCKTVPQQSLLQRIRADLRRL